jgi:PAS domain S-box-containing protein
VLWNRAAQRVFGYTEAEIIGRLTTLLIPEEAAQAHKEAFQQLVCSDGVVSRGVVELTGRRKDGTEFPGEVSIALHKTENGTFVTAIIRDVSERKKAESEREMLLASLEHALKEVKTLSGIIPICAGCKKIRNDKGFWDQVETYISNHSEAHFSHGLCPDCIRKYYPEFAQDQRTDDALKHGS